MRESKDYERAPLPRSPWEAPLRSGLVPGASAPPFPREQDRFYPQTVSRAQGLRHFSELQDFQRVGLTQPHRTQGESKGTPLPEMPRWRACCRHLNPRA
jgi:hypothetical protein